MPASDTSNRAAGELIDGVALDPRQAVGSLEPSSKTVPAVEKQHSVATDDKTVISKRPPLAAGAVPFAGSPQLMGRTLVGKRLEHYELNEFVGGGGMGAVFRAYDTRLDRIVAVKVLSRDHSDEETIRRFRNEAQSAARLDHPNIARVYYVGEDQGLNFIVFEFIEGVNLREEVERSGPLDLERALHYMLQVAEALDHSSRRDVVHRDIKPSNVLVTAEGQVKLVDMGLARLHQVESSADELTASGVTLGTFDYISPEQARDPRAADVRSDIYSLGCTLFYMLTGQPPFPDGTALQKLLRHNSDDPPDVRLFRPELSPRVAALLAKTLAKRPSQRQQTAAELIADVVGLGEQLGLKSVAEFGRLVIVPSSTPGRWGSKVWQALAAGALLVAAVVVMETLFSPRQAGGDMVVTPQFNGNGDAARQTDDESQRERQAIDADERMTADTTIPLPFKAVTPSALVSEDTPEPDASSGVRPDLSAPVAVANEVNGGGTTTSTLEATGRTASVEPARRIVVLGEMPTPPEPQTEFVTTLAEACARAAELGLSEVELRYTGELVEQPLELSNQRLTVRAVTGYRPLVVFRPQSAVGDRHMIHLAGGSAAHVAFDGIELRMELPGDLYADGWSLFAMGTGQSLDLTDCVLTVQDGASEQPSMHEQVSMIAVQRRRPGEGMTMTDPQLAMGQQAKIALERTIARGEASLVSLTDETPLTLSWNQGLLVTSKRLIETGGSTTEPEYYEEIVLDLDNVTAVCRQGLYYLRRGPGKSYQFQINAYADQCVFVTDAGSPLFEMVGLAAPPETHELQSTGEGNRFSPADMPFLFIRTAPGAEPQSFRLGRNWSSETRSQAGVPWVHAPRWDQPPHESTKKDFAIEIDPVAGGAGFDPLLLPDLVAPAP